MPIKVKIHSQNNWLHEAGYTVEEEAQIYEDQLQDLLDNTAWYLDNYPQLSTYRVSWKNYRKTTPVIPYSLVRKVDKNK